MIDGNYIDLGEYCVMYRIARSLYCTPETNIILYANDTSIKQRNGVSVQEGEKCEWHTKIGRMDDPTTCCLQQMVESN